MSEPNKISKKQVEERLHWVMEAELISTTSSKTNENYRKALEIAIKKGLQYQPIEAVYYIELLDNLIKSITDKILKASSYDHVLGEVLKYIKEIKTTAITKQEKQLPNSQNLVP